MHYQFYAIKINAPTNPQKRRKSKTIEKASHSPEQQILHIET